jgi:hypothetical protein
MHHFCGIVGAFGSLGSAGWRTHPAMTFSDDVPLRQQFVTPPPGFSARG